MTQDEINTLLDKVNDAAKAAVEAENSKKNKENLTKEQVEKMIADAVEQTGELATLKRAGENTCQFLKSLKEVGTAIINSVCN